MTPGPNSVSADAPPIDLQPLLRRLCDRSADVVFFPVRHHSPLAAALVAQAIAETKPAAVLIEGPSDYNEHFSELMLDHDLPIAIYSYFQTTDGHSSGAYYPFCEYSPEWSAVRAGSRAGSAVRFIDLPWNVMAAGDTMTRSASIRSKRHAFVPRRNESPTRRS